MCEAVLLLPSRKLLNTIAEIISFYFDDVEFDINKEYFYIHNNHIYFSKASDYEIISPSEIEVLNFITKRKISEPEYVRLMNILANFSEKCDKSSNTDCSKCTLHDKNHCLLKMFSVIDGYRPHPHHGQEFGDVAFNINYKGNSLVFQGIAKSVPSYSLTSGSVVGREIFQQFYKGTIDSRVHVLGPICPTKFDEQLIEDLKYLARIDFKVRRHN